jgi:hypothetical protein
VLASHPSSSLAGLGTPVGDEIEEWLGTIAAVRPRLAALDAHQLADERFAARLDRPGDVWQQARPPGEEDPATRLHVAFGPEKAFTAGAAFTYVAVSLVDEFTEVIPARQAPTPARERTLTAAVGFNAPAARAPQAILLAVPPAVDRDLDGEALARIVNETRELARARMAGPRGLDDFAAGLPVAPQPRPRSTGLDLAPEAEW